MDNSKINYNTDCGSKIFGGEYYHDDANSDVRRAQKLSLARKRQGARFGKKLIARGAAPYIALGERLIACGPNARCGSGACPQCGVAVQRWFGAELLGWLGQEAKPVMVSVIPTDRALAPAALKNDDLGRQKAWLQDTLHRAGLGRMPFVAALDVSLNSFGASGPPSFWQPHWCGFTAGRDTATLTALLSPAAGKADHVEKPIVSKPIRSRLEYVLSYGYKTRFEERYRPDEPDEADIPIDERHPRFRPLMAYLDRIGLMGRIYTQNLELES